MASKQKYEEGKNVNKRQAHVYSENLYAMVETNLEESSFTSEVASIL